MQVRKHLDFKQVASAALSSADSLLRAWLPFGKREGHEYKSVNPMRGDNEPGSFSINLNTGAWGDFATDDVGGDLISLYAYLNTNGDQLKAAKEVSAQLGIRIEDQTKPLANETRARSDWKPLLPAPANAGEPPAAHVKRGKPERTWRYAGPDGETLGFIYRFVTSDGGKEILPLTWCENGLTKAQEWRWMAFSEPRPMYGLDRLKSKPDAFVLVVEGEKCADIAIDILPELVIVTWPGGSKAMDKIDWSPLFGRNVLLWPDCDAQLDKAGSVLPENAQPGIKAMERIAQILHENDTKARIVQIPKPGEKPSGWDIADAVADGMDADAIKLFIKRLRNPAATSPPRSAAAMPGYEAWRATLIRKSRGGYEDCRENVFMVLQNHSTWQGLIAMEEFSNRIVKRRETPFGSPVGEWTSSDDLELGLWLAQNMDILVKAEGSIVAGVQMAANKNRFHAVREYLDTLKWDGTARLDYWLSECLGADATEYHRIAGRIFLIGMVARAMRPGCRMQYMLILEGKQGKGKSTALRLLGGQWFADTPLKLGDKDTFLAIAGKWLYEVAEMDAFNKKDVTEVKAFVTVECDRFREPYARRMSESPRQTVFAGTTNHSEYFKDSTGNRRFMPVMTGNHDLTKMAEWRDQLFAEALQAFKSGEQWHPSREQEVSYFLPEQEKRELTDPWLDAIAWWVDNDLETIALKELTALQILTGALGVSRDKIDGNRSMVTRVGNIMAKLGWDKKRQPVGLRLWVYVRPARAEQGVDDSVPF